MPRNDGANGTVEHIPSRCLDKADRETTRAPLCGHSLHTARRMTISPARSNSAAPHMQYVPHRIKAM